MKRKGVSAIISAVLVMGVAVSVASLYSGWAPGFTKNLTQRYTDDSTADVKCNNAGLDIRNADYDRSANDLVFEVSNTGTIRFNEKIDIVAFKNSKLIGSTKVQGLDVQKTVIATITTNKDPDEIIASPTECSRLTAKEQYINITS